MYSSRVHTRSASCWKRRMRSIGPLASVGKNVTKKTRSASGNAVIRPSVISRTTAMTRNDRYETPRKPMLSVGNRFATLTATSGTVAAAATSRAIQGFTWMAQAEVQPALEQCHLEHKEAEQPPQLPGGPAEHQHD